MSDLVEKLFQRCFEATDRIEALEAEVQRLREALRPFAKAGEIMPPRKAHDFDMSIYAPAAGAEYSISGDDLRRARAALREAIPGLDALIAGTGVVPTVELSSEAWAAISALPSNADGRLHFKAVGLKDGVQVRYPFRVEASK